MLNLVDLKFNSQALENVAACVKTGWISSRGKFVREFEQRFAEYIDCKHAIATSSGTAALHLALTTLNISRNDEVLVPSFTFIASANAVSFTGARPIFADVSPKTWCLDITEIRKKVTSKTRAIVPVHLNGMPCEMFGVLSLAAERDLIVVEDCCQALGAEYKNHKVGSLGHVGCFSFFANKHLTTGEGGMCTTNSDAIAEGIRTFRDHGRTNNRYYVHDVIGFNYRMTNLQAAVGLSQISGLDGEVTRRRRLNQKYFEVLGNDVNAQSWYFGQSPWLYHLRLHNEQEVESAMSSLEKAGIESKPFYKPCHLQKPYCNGDVKLPVSEKLFGVMLPLHGGVTSEHIKRMKEVLA